MIFGSRPRRCTALRIAARSTISGTPVKSCKTMRATTNGISSFAGDFAFHFASASTSLRRTFFPSQLRSTDSRTIRMLTGNREILPISCSSRAGNEKKSPSRPLPASNVLSVLNSSVISLSFRAKSRHLWLLSREDIQRFLDSARNDKSSFQLRQLRFDLLEIWQLPRVVIALGVLDHPVLVDDERRALGHAAHPKIHLRQERVVHHAIFLRDFVFIVAQQRHRNPFPLRPRFLRKWIVAADSVHVGLQIGVAVQARAHFAHFRRTRARERHWEEKQQRVFLSEIVAELDLLRSVSGFGR